MQNLTFVIKVGGNYLFSTAHRVVENICPYGLSNTKPVEQVL